MNKISLLNVEYLRPKRCVETYELSLKNEKEICYIYNFENKFFRYFKTLRSLTNYLKDRIEPKIKFSDRIELNDFLRYKNVLLKDQEEKELCNFDV